MERAKESEGRVKRKEREGGEEKPLPLEISGDCLRLWLSLRTGPACLTLLEILEIYWNYFPSGNL